MYSLKERFAGRKGSEGQREIMRVKCWEMVLDAGGGCGTVAFSVAADADFAAPVVVNDLDAMKTIEESVFGLMGIWSMELKEY